MIINKHNLIGALLFLSIICTGLGDNRSSITQTVYGFLDFTTTIGNTVMVFSPQSAPSLGKIKDFTAVIETKPIKNTLLMKGKKIQPTKPLFTLNSESNNLKTKQKSVEVNNNKSETDNKYELQSNLPIEDNLFKENYNLLSRQPAEYVEETYRVVDLKSNSQIPHGRSMKNPHLNTKSNSASNGNHPVGLVTKIDQTVSKNGVTTIHRTSVIGTYISGKYAQVLQSSEQVVKNEKLTITPSFPARVLKTGTLSLPKTFLTLKESTLRHSGFRAKSKSIDSPLSKFENDTFHKNNNENDNPSTRKTQQRKKSANRRNKISRNTVSKAIKTSTQHPTTDITGRKSFRSKTLSSGDNSELSTASLFMFKLNRTPGRWQYKTSPKPRVIIRRPSESQTHSLLSNDFANSTVTSVIDLHMNETFTKNSILEPEDIEFSADSENDVGNQKYLLETVNVEISTPSNFKDVYYEIATIKSPYTFQAGNVKKTRIITLTSTLEKTLEPTVTATTSLIGPLTENILEPTIGLKELLLDTSITTHAPMYLSEESETPPLETTTEVFSLINRKLKTEVLPVIRNNHTNYLTLINTYDMTNFITATKTLLPLDSNQFLQFKSLTIFNSNLDEAGSELNLELDFNSNKNAENESDESFSEIKNADLELINNKKNSATVVLSADEKLHFSKNPSPSQPFYSDPLQQLALLNYFSPTKEILPIGSTHPVIKIETIYESFVVPVINGMITSFRTLSKSVGTIDKTEYTTKTQPFITPPSSNSFNPFFMNLQQQFHLVTSSVVQETVVTQTNSKVLKLTFGAKTAYTTLFSTNIVPTLLTSFITTSLTIPNTAPFPGYFPHPYPPFPFIG